MQNYYDNIVGVLKTIRNREVKFSLYSHSLILFLTLASVLLLYIIFSIFIHSPVLDKIFLFTSFAPIAFFLGYSLFRGLKIWPLESVCIRIENRFPQYKDKILPAVQLFRKRDSKENYSEALINTILLNVDKLLKKLDINGLVDKSKLQSLERIALGSFICILALAAFIPSKFYLPLFLFGKHQSYHKTILKVFPKDAEVIKGDDVVVTVHTLGRPPKEVFLCLKEDGSSWRRKDLYEKEKGVYQTELLNLQRDLTYYAATDKRKSKSYLLSIVELPEITNLSLKFFYPAYTKLPPLTLNENNGDILSIVGTAVEIEGESSNELSECEAVFSDFTIKTGRVRENSFKLNLTVVKAISYHIEIEDRFGNRNREPIEYTITPVIDEFPSIKILYPAKDIELPREMEVDIECKVLDDFGITKTELCYKTDDDSSVIEISDLAGDVSEKVLTYRWDLTTLGLLPGDLVEYYLKTFDNDTYSGPKSARSKLYTIRFPTMLEIYKKVAEKQTESMDEMSELLPEQRRLKEELERIIEELKTTNVLSWGEKKSTEELIKHQQELMERMEKTVSDLKGAIEEMNKSVIVDEEALKKMQEIAELLSEVLTEEMKKALQKLQDAMESMNPEEVKKAFEELRLSQKELKERLDRTLEILTRLRQEQKLKELLCELDQLIAEEESLRDRTEKDLELEPLSSHQEDIRRHLEEIKNDVDKLSEELADSDYEVSSSLKEEVKNLTEISQKMAEISSSLLEENRKEALSKEGEVLSNLSSLREGLASASASLVSERKKELEKAINNVIKDLLYLSRRQEEINRKIADAQKSSSVDTRELAVMEENLKMGLRRVADNVYNLSQKTLFIQPVTGMHLGRALAGLESGKASLENGDPRRAFTEGIGIMSSLNQATLTLLESQNELSAASSSAGLQEAMQKLAGLTARQAALNKATQGLFSFGEGLSMEARASMARLAAEQEAIRKGMEGVASTFDERAELAGRLDKVIEEMKQLTEDLKSQAIDRKMIERQEKILTRLLDAQRSVRRRDYSKKRKSEVGEDVHRRSPSLLDAEEREKRIKEDLLRALKEGYPPEYEALIKAYFRALSE